MTPPDTPVRVQHRSGALWVFNSAAMRASGLDASEEPGVDRHTGRLWRRDDLVRRVSVLSPDDLGGIGTRAAALGVTGFTDATPNGATADARATSRATCVPRASSNCCTSWRRPAESRLMRPATALGPVKVMLDDDALPTIDELGETIRAAHAEHRAAAFHCVTRLQLVVAITALDTAGARPGDRIEHGSVIPGEMLAHLRRLHVTVVTQPHFVAERGDDYLREVAADDRDSLYRVRSLVNAGIPVAAGTDAPFGGFDPWASMAAAVTRRTRAGQDVGAGERIDARAAVDLFLGSAGAPASPRTIAVGQPGDLCVLGVPWRALPSALTDAPVRRTYIAGTPVYEH